MELNVFISVYTNSITHPENMECEKCLCASVWMSSIVLSGDKMAYRHVNILGGMFIFALASPMEILVLCTTRDVYTLYSLTHTHTHTHRSHIAHTLCKEQNIDFEQEAFYVIILLWWAHCAHFD